MIFVTVGSELPFDRMVRVIDEWAKANGRTDVFAQIAESEYRPTCIRYSKFLEPSEFSEHLANATVVIAHAGMGTILSALQREKPVLVMPRRAALREVRNEHQLATVRHLVKMGLVNAAFDETELRQQLDRIDTLARPTKISPYAGPELITALRNFIAGS